MINEIADYLEIESEFSVSLETCFWIAVFHVKHYVPMAMFHVKQE